MFKRLRLRTFLMVLLLTACEKDDICVDGDSAILQIEFRDAANPEITKNVAGLSVYLDDEVYQGLNNTTASKLALALATDQTTYAFDFFQAEIETPDKIEVAVTPKATYVSRACGFVLQFEQLTVNGRSQKSWISSVEVLQTTITASNGPHLVIYH